MRKGIIIGLVLLSVIGCMGQTKSGKEKIQELKTMGNQKEIYLAGGCFWGTEHFMKQIRGVTAQLQILPIGRCAVGVQMLLRP